MPRIQHLAIFVACSASVIARSQTFDDLCAAQQLEVDRIKKWVSYDRSAQTPNLATNLAKLAAANASLKLCQSTAQIQVPLLDKRVSALLDAVWGSVTIQVKVTDLRNWLGMPATMSSSNDVLNVSPGVHTTEVRWDSTKSLSDGYEFSGTNEPAIFNITFLVGHRYWFKAAQCLDEGENKSRNSVMFWVEDAADRSIVAGSKQPCPPTASQVLAELSACEELKRRYGILWDGLTMPTLARAFASQVKALKEEAGFSTDFCSPSSPY